MEDARARIELQQLKGAVIHVAQPRSISGGCQLFGQVLSRTTICTIVLSRQISLSTNTWLSNVETTVADYKWIYSRSTGKLGRLLLRTDKAGHPCGSNALFDPLEKRGRGVRSADM
ncbi:unnamed protein product [Porites evermanni]|uniref:Uncharacterized protein n=1 Tax=Porites evermanni TaxID=104178 RepID=A0ABN8M286_9CNID|nr:unnamed protein product [Porites evermanni]